MVNSDVSTDVSTDVVARRGSESMKLSTRRLSREKAETERHGYQIECDGVEARGRYVGRSKYNPGGGYGSCDPSAPPIAFQAGRRADLRVPPRRVGPSRSSVRGTYLYLHLYLYVSRACLGWSEGESLAMAKRKGQEFWKIELNDPFSLAYVADVSGRFQSKNIRGKIRIESGERAD